MAAARKKSPAGTGRARRRRGKAAEPASRGLAAPDLAGPAPGEVEELCAAIERDGGGVLARYRDPFGGHWQVLAALPIDKVEPTPFQRDLSETHVRRLADVIGRLERFIDPITVVRSRDGYWTPNGHHRLAALRGLGARSVVALVLPDESLAYRILALNTEKAHNIREKSLEVVRMARALADLDPRPESEHELAFEEAPFLTLGLCYEKRGRFSGGAYHPLLRRCDRFLDLPLPQALAERERFAARLLEIDDAVGEAVRALKERGFDSPYLRAFVVARVNPVRFHRGDAPPLEPALDKMLAAAKKFDASRVRGDQVARAGGPPDDAE